MIQAIAPTLTLQEFLQLPETKPASEYIEGRISQKIMPQGKHSAIQTELASLLNAALRSKRIARAFAELRCTFGDRSIVPDISVFSWDRILRDENSEIANAFQIAPDWTIEILSPDQSQTKVTKNILHCLKYGTQMGWLIDPSEQTVFVYESKREIQVFDLPETMLPFPDFANLVQLSLRDLFELLLA
ncbi:Putative restriction endonuclease domain-containing protein [Tumidithrix helvetica PCC 7403]|uniref:Uma2 family endonuclease n=1 Tax=Tumidithrix helvetica TaxID=3457545 RepID=UPI003C8445FD